MSVYKKGGRWYSDLYDIDGRRIRQSIKISGKNPAEITRFEALKIEAVRKAKLATGERLANQKNQITFKKLVSLYLGWVGENHKRPERDKIACDHLLAYFKNIKASKINLFMVEGFKNFRKKQGRKEETINKELGCLRQMFNLGVEWEKLHVSPIKGLKLLKVPPRKYRILKDSEFEKLFESASTRFQPILLTGFLTGMRKSEIKNLKWENVDLVENYIYVENTKNNENRKIPINKVLKDTLYRLKEVARGEFVFTVDEMTPYSSESAWKRTWATTLKKAGINEFRFHDLRHTFISNLVVKHGQDLITVMSISGHKSISMLQKYSHTQEPAKRAAVEKLTENLKGAENNILEISDYKQT